MREVESAADTVAKRVTERKQRVDAAEEDNGCDDGERFGQVILLLAAILQARAVHYDHSTRRTLSGDADRRVQDGAARPG